jgi:hypothetical protein
VHLVVVVVLPLMELQQHQLLVEMVDRDRLLQLQAHQYQELAVVVVLAQQLEELVELGVEVKVETQATRV